MKYFVLLLFVYTASGCASQQQLKTDSIPIQVKFPITITGTIKDSVTNETIFRNTQVSVWKMGKPFKWAINERDGNFNLTINETDLQDGYVCIKVDAPGGYYQKHFDLIINKCFKNEPLTILLILIPENTPGADMAGFHIPTEAELIADSLQNIEMHKYIKTLPPCK